MILRIDNVFVGIYSSPTFRRKWGKRSFAKKKMPEWKETEIKFTSEFVCTSARRVLRQRQPLTGRSFNGGEIRDSWVSVEIHRDYWQRRKTFVPVKRKTSFGARLSKKIPTIFSFIILPANQTFYFRPITTVKLCRFSVRLNWWE